VGNALSVKIRPYLKFPMPWNWTKNIGGEDVFDFRMDFPTTIEIRVNEDFSVRLNHTIFYDNTPSSALIDDLLDQNGEPVSISLNKIHQFTTFQASFQIN
ncbi:MAG: hypothetical protein AAFP77_31700, partial [Bacteroidota bacterium]